MSYYCVKAAQFIGDMKQIALEAHNEALQAADLLGTSEEPPRSTPLMDQAKARIQKIANMVPKMKQAVSNFKNVLPGLEEGIRGLNAATDREKALDAKVTMYDKLTAELQTLANKIENDAKRIGEQKENIRGYLRQWQARAAANDKVRFSNLEAKLDALEIPPEWPDRVKEARKVVWGSDKVVAAARAALKSAFDRVRNEGQDCQTFPGADAAKEARKQAGEAVKDFEASFLAIAGMYEARKNKVNNWLNIGKKNIPRYSDKVEEAKSAGDRNTQKKAEEALNALKERHENDKGVAIFS